MSAVFLIGGGRDPDGSGLAHAPFLAVAGDSIVAFVLEEDGADPQRWMDALDGRARVVTVSAQRPPQADDLAGATGVYVAGGWTPGYADAFAGFAVPDGLPYAGYSAGAAIAAERAVVGGWQINAVPVCSEDAGEDLAAVEIRDGLGLVPFAVDVHAAQWGTVSRLVAAVEAGLVTTGIAIDEHTCVEWPRGGGDLSVHGAGAAWHVEREAGGVRVARMTK